MIGAAISEAEPPLQEADVQVVYTAEVKRLDRGGLQKMNYNDFLTALMKLAIRVYPRSRTVDEAFQRLLMDNVLPLASRRCPDNVAAILQHEDVQRLFEYYGEALEQIFQFYASCDKRTTKAMQAAAMASGAVSAAYPGAGSFTVSGRSPGRATRASNTMKDALGYAELLKFASDFDLASTVLLSTLELGDIFLSSLKNVAPDATIRKLSFPEFWEALVRCSLVAYSKISDASVVDKLRGLFLYMWRSMNKSVPRAFAERRNVTTYAGDLLSGEWEGWRKWEEGVWPPKTLRAGWPHPRFVHPLPPSPGAMLFNKRFTAAWAADGYRDYLSPDATPLESGKVVLSRLLKFGGEGAGALGSAAAAGMLMDGRGSPGRGVLGSAARGGGGEPSIAAELEGLGYRGDGGEGERTYGY